MGVFFRWLRRIVIIAVSATGLRLCISYICKWTEQCTDANVRAIFAAVLLLALVVLGLVAWLKRRQARPQRQYMRDPVSRGVVTRRR
jgi:Ca2+/Na+ antiporter